MAHEVCDSCKAAYDFTPQNARINLFIEDPECNHVLAVCPNCGRNEIIYCIADTLVHVLMECGLQLGVAPRADEELKARAASMWGTVFGEDSDEVEELPDAPHWLLRELFDDIREWNKGGEPESWET